MEQAADKETCSMEYKKGWEEEENTLREFPLVIAIVVKVSRKRGFWLVIRVNKRKAGKKRSTFFAPPERTVHWLEDGLGMRKWKVASEPEQ